MPRDNLDYIKAKIKDLALTSFRHYNANIPQHLSNEEFEALKNLSANCNLNIQKADKGNSVEKDVYIRRLFERFLMMLQSLKKLKLRKKFSIFQLTMTDV